MADRKDVLIRMQEDLKEDISNRNSRRIKWGMVIDLRK